MLYLDIFTRAIFIPGVLLYTLYSFIPEAIKDIKEWSKLFRSPEKETVRIHTFVPVMYSDSSLVSQNPK
ncbi:MAG TPA: hypothetical protein PLF27_10320 [Sedimentibacter sp.]|nr:hypothetical protein [Sedimentibacter sp.]